MLVKKVSLIAAVPKELTSQVKAGDIIKTWLNCRRKRWRSSRYGTRWRHTPENISESLRFIKDYIKTYNFLINWCKINM